MSNDLISRQAAIDAFTGVVILEPAQSAKKYIDGVIERIQNLPSAQHQQVTGKLDLISRQDAIDALKHNQDVYSHNFHDDPIDKYTTAIIATDIETVVNLPSAQPERKKGKWIPCSEKMPIGQVEVIVSCHDDHGDTPFDYTSCGFATTDGEYWIVDNEINNHVVAWMPLPKPYKGE